jgi:hypothetical protein
MRRPRGRAGQVGWAYPEKLANRQTAYSSENDVVNTYRVWLRYELFRGRLSEAEHQGSEAVLVGFIKAHSNTKPHFAGLV